MSDVEHMVGRARDLARQAGEEARRSTAIDTSTTAVLLDLAASVEGLADAVVALAARD